jgi:hypothetical protein
LRLQICFGWGIGISRIIDNKHSTADVVGGFVLGAMFGLVFVLKVSTHRPILCFAVNNPTTPDCWHPAHCVQAIPTAKYVVGRGERDQCGDVCKSIVRVFVAWSCDPSAVIGAGPQFEMAYSQRLDECV